MRKHLIIITSGVNLMAKLYVLLRSYKRNLELLILYYSLRSYMKQVIIWLKIMILNET